MSHKPQKLQFEMKREKPPEFDDVDREIGWYEGLMELISEANNKAEQRELNQGDTNGRDKGN